VRLSIQDAGGTTGAASLRRAPGVDEFHGDAREACEQRRAFLDLQITSALATTRATMS
ncbi:MAG: hypothetical protein GYA24_10875, partial [Candidatus Lokiarchaeota archaeon]|nr:hypothetical protein [Candidatus Lokiarchaeota archaeon]